MQIFLHYETQAFLITLQHKAPFIYNVDQGRIHDFAKGGQFLIVCVQIDVTVSFMIISIHLLSYVVDR